MAGAIFDSRLFQTLPKNSPVGEANFSDDLRKLVHLEPITLRLEVLHDVSSALSVSYIIRLAAGSSINFAFSVYLDHLRMLPGLGVSG